MQQFSDLKNEEKEQWNTYYKSLTPTSDGITYQTKKGKSQGPENKNGNRIELEVLYITLLVAVNSFGRAFNPRERRVYIYAYIYIYIYIYRERERERDIFMVLRWGFCEYSRKNDTRTKWNVSLIYLISYV